MRGVSRGEEYELVFASVPLEVWDKGPAAANVWIREHLPKGAETLSRPDLPQPLPDLDSPFAYAWNASARVTIVAGAQNLPFYRFFKSEEEHRQSLERCRASAERLLESLGDGRYGNAVRREYAERLRYYINDLPKIAGVGNIMLADDEVRVLYAMFVQDAEALPSPFAAALARVIANQFALNDFYDVVRRHEQAVNAGNWTQPFPFEPAKRFFGAVDEYTPRIFEPEVGEGLHRVERASASGHLGARGSHRAVVRDPTARTADRRAQCGAVARTSDRYCRKRALESFPQRQGLACGDRGLDAGRAQARRERRPDPRLSARSRDAALKRAGVWSGRQAPRP